jgi:hypothetical protein
MKKNLLLVSLILFSLLSISSSAQPIEYPLRLDVLPLAQSQTTSCGEAALVMLYNYAFPQAPLKESDMIRFAISKGYYTPDWAPFTSPADMANILENYTEDYTGGTIAKADEGLELLVRNLYEGRPVIIDVTTHLDRPGSSAHFVVVTGLSYDANNGNAITIYYNNPLTGKNESAPWDGKNGVWNAWQNNGDPGGAGWWLVISPQ